MKYNAFDKDLQLWVGGLPVQGRRRRAPPVRRRDGRADRRPALPAGPVAGHDAAGARGHVAAPTGRRSTGTGRSRWTRCTSTTPSASTCIRSPRPGCVALTLPGPLRRGTENLALLITTGFLPQRFRDEMRLPWDAARQRRFDRLIAVLRAVNKVSPRCRPRVPVQRSAQGRGLAYPDRPPTGVSPFGSGGSVIWLTPYAGTRASRQFGYAMLTSAKVSLGIHNQREGDGGGPGLGRSTGRRQYRDTQFMEMGSDTLAVPATGAPRVDPDVVSRFATCCRALGLSVHDRQRPADLHAARSGFAALTRIANDQCDAWTGLAAAGDASPQVIEAVWQTSATAGAAAARDRAGPRGARLHSTTPACTSSSAPPRVTTSRSPTPRGWPTLPTDPDGWPRRTVWWANSSTADPAGCRPRWVRAAIYYRAARWSDVVRLLTPVVTDDVARRDLCPRRPRDARHRSGPTGHVRPGAVAPRATRRTDRRRGRRRRVRQGAGTAGPGRGRGRHRTAAGALRRQPREHRQSRTRCRTRRSASPPPPRRASRRAPTPGTRTASRAKPTSSTPAPRTARPTCSSRPRRSWPSSSASKRSSIRSPG